MQFKNLQAYSLPADFFLTAAQLETELAAKPFAPCTGMSMRTEGWVAPRGDGQLVYSCGNHYLIALHVEERNIPASVINRDVKVILDEIESQQLFKANKAQKAAAKAKVLAELTPKTFAKPRTTLAWIDLDNHIVAIDASTPNRAEELVCSLRDTLGSLPISAIDTEISTQQGMTTWLLTGEAPPDFNLEPDGELRSINNDSAGGETIIRYSGYDLNSQDIKDHINAGKRAISVGLTHKDRITFQLLSPLQIKRIKTLDIPADSEQPASGAPDSEEMAFEADFLLMTATYSVLIADIIASLGGLKAVDESPVATGAAADSPSASYDVLAEAADDPLYGASGDLIRSSGKASVSFIQRSFKIGYNRAARLVEQHEVDGLVGPSGPGGEREVRAAALQQAA